MKAKNEIYNEELKKLTSIFEKVEESKKLLVEGLIEDAAFLKAENYVLKAVMEKTGMVKIHPERRELQKLLEAPKQYLKNVNSYSVIIKTLNGILQKNALGEPDAFDEFMEEMKNARNDSL